MVDYSRGQIVKKMICFSHSSFSFDSICHNTIHIVAPAQGMHSTNSRSPSFNVSKSAELVCLRTNFINFLFFLLSWPMQPTNIFL